MERESLILSKLDLIKKELDILREDFDDRFLSRDDILSLEEADKDFKEGRTISHKELKKELGL